MKRLVVFTVKLRTFEEVGLAILVVLIVIALIGLLINKYYGQPEIIEPIDTVEVLYDAVEQGNLSMCDDLNPAKREVCKRSILERLGG